MYFNIFIFKFYICQVSKEELSKVALGFDNQDTLTSSGITLANVRYIYLSGTDKVIRAKQGKVGAHCVKTQQSKLCFKYSYTF